MKHFTQQYATSDSYREEVKAWCWHSLFLQWSAEVGIAQHRAGLNGGKNETFRSVLGKM